ncbi:MAG TPA: hypothetical protein VKJ00_04350 [Thermoanaerobaculia bacterium]|nr:hypothetical protein [Thermoanaerobaculia bacterium]
MTMRKYAAPGFLGALAIALYLWTAFTAPVVLWSDSQTDLAWAKQGLGIFKPIPPPAHGKPIDHLPKPGYLLFLRGAMLALPPLGETRSVVVVQSLLLALSILGTSLWIARRRGPGVGAAVAVVCLLFLRLRDASSAVMTEALAAALLLPIGAVLLEPAGWRGAGLLHGAMCGALFLVRPNCGGAVVLIAAVVFAAAREIRRLVFFLAGFAVLIVPFWYLGRSNLPGDPLHGLGYQIVEGSADYYWAPSISPWPVGETPGKAVAEELRVAQENWKRTFASAEPDWMRQIVWRAFHGFLGIEFYDFRWFDPYALAANISRWISPFFILAAMAILAAAPWREGRGKLCGVLLLLIFIGQDLVLGSNPRYALPLLPLLFVFALAAAGPFFGARRGRGVIALVFFAGLIVAAWWQRQILDWQWGKIESADVTLLQEIPKGSLPTSEPATLHVRIASAHAAAPAGLEVFVPPKKVLYSIGKETARGNPVLTIPLPAWLLEANRSGPVTLSLRSTGSYGETSFLLFPVIPPPWARPTYRDGSRELSPSTGIRRGALDWWAHPGSDRAGGASPSPTAPPLHEQPR